MAECSLDLTPITQVYMPSVNTYVGNFALPHTCRDKTKIEEWLDERRNSKEILDRYNHRLEVFKAEHPGEEPPEVGYVWNNDAKNPWNWTHSEFN